MRSRDRLAARRSVLLLCDDHRGAATTILEHIDAFRRCSRHSVSTFNPRALDRIRSLTLEEFDVVVIHYSLAAFSDHYLPRELRERISDYGGLKIQYIQDDYRQVDDVSATIRRLGIDVLFTLVSPRDRDRVWHALPDVETRTTLAGYVSDSALRFPAPPLADRPVDVGYRGRTLPYWIGALGQEKAWIAQGFLERVQGADLTHDIGWRESDRIYGRSWFEWLSSCRATLGTESGASITDFDGSLQRLTDAYLRQHPDADFDEVHRTLLAPHEGNVMMNVVSPRIFEAAALRTALVLFPGDYSGVVERDHHYVGLEKDFSNFDEVVERIRDLRGLDAMVRRTYEEIAGSGRYSVRAMVEEFDKVVDERATAHKSHPGRLQYRLARAERGLRFALQPSRAPQRIATGERSGLAIRSVAAARLLAGDPRTGIFLARALLGIRSRLMLAQLTRDLVRLAAIRRAQQGRLNAGEHFVVGAWLSDDARELRLTSTPPRPGTGCEAASAAGLLRAGQLERIEWDHSAIGNSFPYAVGRNFWVTFPVGSDGRHVFDLLPELGRRNPSGVGRMLDVALRTPPVDPETLRVIPRGFALALHFARHLDHYLPKLLALILLLLRDTRTRRVTAAAFGIHSLRVSTSVREIAAEAVKLGLLHRMREGGLVPGARAVALVDQRGRIRFRSTTEPDAADAGLGGLTPAEVTGLVWDHGALGTVVAAANGPSLALGTTGEYEFTTIRELLRHRPDVVWPLIGPR